MHRHCLVLLLGLALAQACCQPAGAAAASGEVATAPVAEGVDWRRGDVDAAFAEAKALRRPLFLYWGATWCPPCNQVKATIFNRQQFVERSRQFVAVYIDGDAPNAQRLGARFRVSGYPTMILFSPDGAEITRLPGEVDATRYVQLLDVGMSGGRPAAAVLASALDGHGVASAADWRMLSYYPWDEDEEQLLPKARVLPTLKTLAARCPARYTESCERLILEAAQAASASGAAGDPDAARLKAAALTVLQMLADPARARGQYDLLTQDVAKTAAYLTPPQSAARSNLVAAWDTALERLANDTSLSQTDRLGALEGRVELVRVDDPKAPLPEALVAEVKREVARADRETTDGYERQAVIDQASDLLATAGLDRESDALLMKELPHTHSPYYLMLGLAKNARERGDNAAALSWSEKAYAAAQGPATRLQWGAGYVRSLVRLAPDNTTGIETTSIRLLTELDGNSDLLYERNRAVLTRLGDALGQWATTAERQAALARIEARLAETCQDSLKSADDVRTCMGLMKPTREAHAS